MQEEQGEHHEADAYFNDDVVSVWADCALHAVILAVLGGSELVDIDDHWIRKGIHAVCARIVSRMTPKSQLCLLEGAFAIVNGLFRYSWSNDARLILRRVSSMGAENRKLIVASICKA
jgi:hypothetical protein